MWIVAEKMESFMMNFNPLKTPRFLIIIILFISLLAGCQGVNLIGNPSATQNSSLPESIIVTNTHSDSISTILPIGSYEDVPSPSLFNFSWKDRTPFEIGLNPSSRTTLQERIDRSIYHLVVDVADDYRSMTLKEEVLYTNHEDVDLDKVILRMYPVLFGAQVQYSKFLINGADTQPLIRSYDSVLEFPLKNGLGIGKSIVLSIEIQIKMPDDPSSNYQVFGYVDKLLTLSHFYPIIAVYDQDGWHDEVPPSYGDIVYSDASFYLVKVILPQRAILVSSGSKMEDTTEGDYQVVTLAGGPMRDFFLAAGEDLEKTSIKVGDTLVNSYSSRDLMDGNKSALDTASEAIRIFDKIIGNYPYTEFDILATSTSALGVEYPGVTVINKNIYRPGGNLNDVPNSIYLESTVAHEVGHQWFYNVVGNDQVNQPWLDESITQYITSLYYKNRYGDQASDSFVASFYDRWDRVDKKEIPIGMPVKRYDQKTYGAIVYGRGPIFFITLRDQLGDTDFGLFLKNYYKQNIWEIATETTLKETAEKACSCNLTMLFNRWVDPK
jgi:hypothetical protein